MNLEDVVQFLYKQYLINNNISTDSRHVATNTLFFALKGPSFNGNAFAEQALKKGAAYAVIDDARYQKNDRCILVEDVLVCLQKLANYHRKQLKIPVIAITGSSGKTTTKELIKAVLGCCYATCATQGNLNNHIGVPLTLLSIDQVAEVAIVEMGANHIGEIAQLCEIAMPTYGLITNIGHVHIEGFGSFEGVLKGKSELYDYLLQHNGGVFINSTDPVLSNMGKRFAHPVYYPQEKDFYHCELVTESPSVVYRSENGQVISSHLLGRYHFCNIAAALCVAKFFKVDEAKANKAIQDYQPTNNRSQLIKKGSNIILLDAYNANLESVKGAMQALHLLPSIYKVLILGAMAELGKGSEEAHQEIGRLTTQKRYISSTAMWPQYDSCQRDESRCFILPAKGRARSLLKVSNI